MRKREQKELNFVKDELELAYQEIQALHEQIKNLEDLHLTRIYKETKRVWGKDAYEVRILRDRWERKTEYLAPSGRWENSPVATFEFNGLTYKYFQEAEDYPEIEKEFAEEISCALGKATDMLEAKPIRQCD